MPCYHPYVAFPTVKPDGSPGVPRIIGAVGSVVETDRTIRLSCGQCIGCRLAYSREWAMRIVFESRFHEHNCFLTLTYDDAHLPEDLNLNYRHVQLFLKSLRKELNPVKIRFYCCGEYGEKFKRPHYHLAIFGYDFPDKVPYRVHMGNTYYISSLLASLWPMGFHVIADLNFESAAYIARYMLKKQKGEKVDKRIVQPFSRMSLKPGIAYEHFARYFENIYSNDRCVINGHEVLPPRYFDKCFKKEYPYWADFIKSQRIARFDGLLDNSAPRLKVREAVKLAKCKRLIRPLE